MLVGGSGFLGSAVRSRLVELLASVQPVIEMGARQYSPILGRFLETDPVESGVDNDSNYPEDPVNHDDLSGEGLDPSNLPGWVTVLSSSCDAPRRPRYNLGRLELRQITRWGFDSIGPAASRQGGFIFGVRHLFESRDSKRAGYPRMVK
jgi:hypothetical protein